MFSSEFVTREGDVFLGIQTELANRFGVHRTTLNRAIRKLKDLGVITACTRDGFVIGDVDRLSFFAAQADGGTKPGAFSAE